MHRHQLALACLAIAAALAGCQPSGEVATLQHDLEEARNQVRQCNDDKQSLQSVIVKQQKQVDTLLDLGDKRLEKLFHVKSIELGQYTGGVNLTGTDDSADAIKVYVRPLDQDGSVIKAAGSVKIQLFDLRWAATTSSVSTTGAWMKFPSSGRAISSPISIVSCARGRRRAAQAHGHHGPRRIH